MSTETTPVSPCQLVVTAGNPDERVRAAAIGLAQELGLPFSDADDDSGDGPELTLVAGEHRLELRETRRGGAGSVFVDFVGGPIGYRRQSALSRRQPIALAVGLRRGPVTVVDATAGLARDSFLLACLGCTVIAIERSRVLGALIRDGLARAAAEGPPAVQAILSRITLIVDDARDVLVETTGAAAPDVVYLDPMYPPKKKTALPKKEIRICRRLVGDDPDADELVAVARRVAKRRVVVKRHPHAPPLAPHPALQFAGKQVRYDVYLPHA
ncbi:MAG: class I SAM-dependent methyltransferase [Phycisphaerae bacterium]